MPMPEDFGPLKWYGDTGFGTPMDEKTRRTLSLKDELAQWKKEAREFSWDEGLPISDKPKKESPKKSPKKIPKKNIKAGGIGVRGRNPITSASYTDAKVSKSPMPKKIRTLHTLADATVSKSPKML